MAKIFNVTNHIATNMQIDDAKQTLGVVECIDLPKNLKKSWSEIPPNTDSVVPFLQPVLEWLELVASQEDVVWTQGEWGATMCVLQWCRVHGVRCVYSTTERVATESQTNEGVVTMTHRFKHIRFRDYP